ncbi:MAG: amino acid permease [Acidobacteriota bacterium]|nr:amino acid permease [Acidobacteriota bacterium]
MSKVSVEASNESHTNKGLIRGIRRWDLVAIAINAVIGAGIFGLPSKVFSLIGSYSLIAFAVCALVVALIVLCFAEVGSRFTETGGPYVYAREAFGAVVGFEVGWLLWLVRLTAFAANCNLLVGYFGFFWPAATAGLWRGIVITTVVVALTLVNILGVRQAAITTNIFTIGKLVPIILFIAAGMFFVRPGNYTFAAVPSYGAFSQSVLLLVYAFTGFEMAGIPAGEVRDPRKNLPFAMLIAIAVVALIYILIQLVCIGTFPGLAASQKPLADAASQFLGPVGGAIISAGALISIVGNLNVVLLAGSRVPFAMAVQKELPSVFASTHKRFRTPHVSILISAAAVFVLTISGTFIYALTISTLTRLTTYAVTCAALPVLRRRAHDHPAQFVAPAGVFAAVAALMLALWLLSNSTLTEARDSCIAAGAGLLIYFAYRLSLRSSKTGRPSS